MTTRTDRPLSARALTEMLGDWRNDHDTTYLALAARVRLLIAEGRLLPGTRLPAERPLAVALGVSRTTIVSAYSCLRDDGYLISAQGSGSVITHGNRPRTPRAQPEGIDFSQASPPALTDLAETYARALVQLPGALAVGGFDLVGLPDLRAAIAERYTQRGLPTQADQIMVTVGAQHAISLIARTILARGDRALVEAPTYPHAADALEAAGGRLVSIPVTPDGWDVDQAVNTIERTLPRLGYLMPTFHNPTGATMSADTRTAILTAAEQSGTILIIDETTGEFAFGAETPTPIVPFATYATDDQRRRIITIGSVGKSIWGGVRVGWIRADTALLHRFLAVRAHGDLGTPALEQLLVTEYLPRLDTIIHGRARAFEATAHRIHDYLGHVVPEWDVPVPTGGISTWVNLGAPRSSALAAAARERGLSITSGPRFGIDGAFERRIRIPLTNTTDQVDAGVAVLADTWRSLGTRPDANRLVVDTLV